MGSMWRGLAHLLTDQDSNELTISIEMPLERLQGSGMTTAFML